MIPQPTRVCLQEGCCARTCGGLRACQRVLLLCCSLVCVCGRGGGQARAACRGRFPSVRRRSALQGHRAAPKPLACVCDCVRSVYLLVQLVENGRSCVEVRRAQGGDSPGRKAEKTAAVARNSWRYPALQFLHCVRQSHAGGPPAKHVQGPRTGTSSGVDRQQHTPRSSSSDSA